MNSAVYLILSVRFSVKSELLENHVMSVGICNDNSLM